MKTKLSLFIATSFLLISCQGQTNKSVKTLAVDDYSKLLDSTPNAQLIDVRTPQEYSEDHIGKAENINWNGTDFVSQVEKLDKSKPVFVYCKVGGRSGQAATKLVELGFSNVYNLEGGIMKWNASGKTISAVKSDKIIGICDQEYNEFIKSNKKVVVNFHAEWCAPCKKMTPYLLKMEKEMADKVVIIRLDADKNKSLLSEMKISELPTLLLYENKQIKWKHSGYISEDDLKKQL
jgi:thioredoxin